MLPEFDGNHSANIDKQKKIVYDSVGHTRPQRDTLQYADEISIKNKDGPGKKYANMAKPKVDALSSYYQNLTKEQNKYHNSNKY
mgnify:FL=1